MKANTVTNAAFATYILGLQFDLAALAVQRFTEAANQMKFEPESGSARRSPRNGD